MDDCVWADTFHVAMVHLAAVNSNQFIPPVESETPVYTDMTIYVQIETVEHHSFIVMTKLMMTHFL